MFIYGADNKTSGYCVKNNLEKAMEKIKEIQMNGDFRSWILKTSMKEHCAANKGIGQSWHKHGSMHTLCLQDMVQTHWQQDSLSHWIRIKKYCLSYNTTLFLLQNHSFSLYVLLWSIVKVKPFNSQAHYLWN